MIILHRNILMFHMSATRDNLLLLSCKLGWKLIYSVIFQHFNDIMVQLFYYQGHFLLLQKHTKNISDSRN